MPSFFYTAKSLDGKIKTGIAEAESVRELAQTLKAEGLFLARADSKTKKERGGFGFNFLPGKVSVSEKMLMTRNLWVMVATGLPMVKGFSILAAQSKSKRMKRALLDVSKEVSKGESLSSSLAKYPDIFSELYVGMVRAGEESGVLENALEVLSLQLEKEKQIKSKVSKALIYPIILVIVMIIVAIGLSVYVLPRINIFFTSLHANLPIMTRIILGSGDFFGKYWYLLAMAAFIMAIGFLAMIKTKTGRFVMDTLELKTPLVSSLVKKSNAASLIRSLSSLLSSGVPLIKSLEITSGVVSNFYFKQALKGAAKETERGQKLFVSLEPYRGIFPYGALEMIEIGEETGRTALILKKLAEFYEEEVFDMADELSAVIEPLLIIVIGVAVGIFAVSILGPLYSVLGTI